MNTRFPLLILSSLAAFHSWAGAAETTAGVAKAPEGITSPVYPLQRYKELWDSGWFSPRREDFTAAAPVSAEAEQFSYRFVGIGDIRGHRWVYLADAQGRVVELTPGQPAGDLELMRIDEPVPGSAEGRTVVQIRQGQRLVSLKLVKPAAPSEHPDPKAGSPSVRTSVQSPQQWLRGSVPVRDATSKAPMKK